VVGRKHAELTYKDVDDLSDALAAALSDLGVKKGDRVAIVLPNCAQFVIAFFGILKAGAVVTATNPTYPPAKMAQQFVDAGANTVITLSLFYNAIKSVQKETVIKNVIVTNIKDYLPGLAKVLFTLAKEKKGGHRITRAIEDHDLMDLLKRYAGRKLGVHVTSDDPAIFQYTGGTTGVPKAAVASHNALVANTLQCSSFIGAMTGQESFMAAIPLFHVFGLVSVLGLATTVGGRMLMVPNPREIKEVLEVIDTYKPSFFMGVPAMYNAINNNADVLAGKYNLRSIKACVSGSAPLPPATKLKFEELTGGKLVEGYGMSETPTAISVNPLYGEVRLGSIGLPVPDTEIKIVSLEDGVTEMPVGASGELCVHGPQLMIGYHNMPGETSNVMKPDANGKLWLYTGDIAKMDEDGYLYIVDRKKDMVLIGGFNVYPNNIEKVLTDHAAVQDAAVAGIPHPDKAGQEALKAWIVLREGHSVTEKDLIDFAARKLARYEIPTRIAFVSELPRTSIGKVLRRELVEREKAEQARVN
jgi:long-chain acyl-CoA synthetase